MKKPFPLRVLHELRKTKPLAPREGIGRVFFAQGQPGVADATGCLWPIKWDSSCLGLAQGDVIRFSCSYFRPDGAPVSKYDDSGYSLCIERVLEAVVSSQTGVNVVQPSPLPEVSDLEPLRDIKHTTYFATSHGKRVERLATRGQALKRTHEFFANRGFMAMETPHLVPSGGVEVYLKPFQTTYEDHRGKQWDLELPTSPEFALKKLMTEGFSKVFQIGRAFRNKGELAKWHEPEFFMVEWYRAGAGLGEMLEDTSKFVLSLANHLGSKMVLPGEWPVFKVADLFEAKIGISLAELQDEVDFRIVAKKHSTSIVDSDDWDSIFCKLFMEKIEPFLAEQVACFVSHYPMQMGALARQEKGDGPFVQRFEAYLNGVEICNGYHELSDSKELMGRISNFQAAHSKITRDPVFESALAFGLPPCSGNALGLDRVIALLMGLDSLSALLPVPFLSQFLKETVAPE